MIVAGNAQEMGLERRGWFLGGFIDSSAQALHSETVEIKWATHAAGEMRAEWAEAPAGIHSVSILIRGRFALAFRDGERLLETEGDFVRWGPGDAHTWRAIEESVVVTFRWREAPPAPGAAPESNEAAGTT